MNKIDFSEWEVEPILSDSQWGRCFSPTNIALAKYWGKRDVKLNLPQNGSISASLDHFGSFTTIEFNEKFGEDLVILNGQRYLSRESPVLKKVTTVLVAVRKLAAVNLKARVQTRNNFPTGAGLASSASGLSAVTLGASRALKLDLSKEKLSEIARQGSGSASRSFFDGFAEWSRGQNPDGTDSVARQLMPHTHWPLGVLIAVVQRSEKEKSSTDAMEATAKTSPFFNSWVESAEVQLPEIRKSLLEKNFKTLALLTESNCMRMHGSAMAASPPILYWEPTTLQVMQLVWKLRKEGLALFFTIDAGPNVVIFYEPNHAPRILENFKKVAGVELLVTKVGEGARIL